MTNDLAVQATALRKAYRKGQQVLDGIDLNVARGTVFALLGPNGSGKTTTVRILSTLTRLDSGQATVAGHDVATDAHRLRRAISLTGQYAAIDKNQTGEENLRMMGRLSGLSRSQARARADQLLERFDLVEAGKRRVSTYSGGMVRRLDLAASLVGAPSVVFLDEPTTGLDPRSRQELWRVVAGLASAGLTIFLTTQYLEEADRLADKIALLDGGRIIAEGTPDELKQQVSGQRLDLELVDAQAFASVQSTLDRHAVDLEPELLTISVPTDGSAEHVRTLLDDLDPRRTLIAKFTVRSATLDDVFIALTGHAGPRVEQKEKEISGV